MIGLVRTLACASGVAALVAGLPASSVAAGRMSGSGSAAPPSLLAGVAARTPTDAWAAGAYCTRQCGPAGLVDHALIGQWNGRAWSQVASPGKPAFSSLAAVAALPGGQAWAVGEYCPQACLSSSVSRTLVLSWDGSAWSRVPSPNPGPGPNGILDALTGVSAVSASDVWAVGYGKGTLAEHWDGHTWSIVPSPSPHGVNSQFAAVSAVSASDVWAVGQTTTPAATLLPLIEHWNGHTWSIVPSPNPGNANRILTGVSAGSASSAWAVGTTFGTTEQTTLTEHWNGHAWSIVPSPNPGSVSRSLTGVSVVPAGGAWAVGSFCASTCGSPSNTHTLTEQWNGHTWSVVPSPNPGHGGPNTLGAVTATSASNAWAVGQFCVAPICARPGEDSQAMILHWDGKTWTSVPGPVGGSGRVRKSE